MQNIQALDSRWSLFSTAIGDGNDRKNLSTIFIDAHTHVAFPAYDEDRDAVMFRAQEAGVKMITVGTQVSSSRAAIELAHKYPEDVWATVGYHPAHAVIERSSTICPSTVYPDRSIGAVGADSGLAGIWHHDKNEQKENTPEAFDIEALEALARDPKVVAIGECGLDYFRITNNELGIKNKQKEIFEAQIELAHRVQKPLMIHCRSAFPDLIAAIIHNSKFIIHDNPGIIHFFSGTPAEARELLDMGFAFTFGGVITFSRDYDEVIKILPLERILSETDAPYVAPEPYRSTPLESRRLPTGQARNEPAYVVEVVKKIAKIKGLTTEKMAERILENTKIIFGISSDK